MHYIDDYLNKMELSTTINNFVDEWFNTVTAVYNKKIKNIKIKAQYTLNHTELMNLVKQLGNLNEEFVTLDVNPKQITIIKIIQIHHLDLKNFEIMHRNF